MDSFYVKKLTIFENPIFLPSVLHFKVFNTKTLACLKIYKKIFLKSVHFFLLSQKFVSFLEPNPKKNSTLL